MSRVSIRASQSVNQLDEELFSEFLETVHSFLNVYFRVRHVTVSVGERSDEDGVDTAGYGSFSFSGGDWLTIENTGSEEIEMGFFSSDVFGVTRAFIGGGSSATFRVDEAIEAVDLCIQPGRDTPQLIKVQPPNGSE